MDVLAQRRIIAWQTEQAMAEQNINKVDMAERMKTSRSQVDRLLDPQNNKVRLDTLQRAALAVGGSLRLELTGVRLGKAAGRVKNSVKSSGGGSKSKVAKKRRLKSVMKRGKLV